MSSAFCAYDTVGAGFFSIKDPFRACLTGCFLLLVGCTYWEYKIPSRYPFLLAA
jgi:hypothetical protein